MIDKKTEEIIRNSVASIMGGEKNKTMASNILKIPKFSKISKEILEKERKKIIVIPKFPQLH